MSTNQTWQNGGLGDTSGWGNPNEVQLSGSENSFGTKEGQSVVSVGEQFWGRMSRIGRLLQLSIDGVALGVAGTWENITGSQLIVAPGYRYYIQEVHFSANIDCEVALSMDKGYRVADFPLNHQPGNVNRYSTGFYGMFLKAFTPYRLTFMGEEWVDADIMSMLIMQSRTITASGKFTGYIKGYEVAKNA